MEKKLKDLLEFSHFGAYTKPGKMGDTKFIQLKHFNFNDNQLAEIDSFVDFDKSLEKQLLNEGNILFVTKGNRYFAWCFDKNLGQSVASSTFVILHPNQSIIEPHFLELYLNLPHMLEQVSKLSSNSVIPTLRSADLLELNISVPAKEMQHRLIDIAHSYHRQMSLIDRLKIEKGEYYHSIMNQLFDIK